MVKARRRFGQHFLEPVWVRKLIAIINPSPQDLFLEIGAGRGALTQALGASGARVLAVEIDRALVTDLKQCVSPNVEIIVDDFLKLDVRSLLRGRSPGWPSVERRERIVRLVGNIPYGMTSPVFARLFALCRSGSPFSDAVLMLQREVASRVVARAGSGDYGPLAILVRLYAEAVRVLTLPPGAFRPPPKVWSAVVRLVFRPPPVSLPDLDLFEALVRTLFTQRRKTLANALRPFASARGLATGDVLARAELDARRRPETLELAELARLTELFVSKAGRAVL